MLKLFSIFDTKAMAFLPPFLLPNTEMAIREFTNCVNDKSHSFGRNPDDFLLTELGSFDDIDGVLTSLVPHKIIGYGTIFVQSDKESTA